MENVEKLDLEQNDTAAYVVPTPSQTFTPSQPSNYPMGQQQSSKVSTTKLHDAALYQSPAAKMPEEVSKAESTPKVYNPFPCSHCDGIFLSWGGLFMHK